MREKDVEVRFASDVAPCVRKHGVAIWRKLVPDHITSAMVEPLSGHLRKPKSYVNGRYGVLNLNILSPAVREACVVPQIPDVFSKALGMPFVWAIQEIYVTRLGFYSPHPWHQDANAGNKEYRFMTWIAATPCGVNAAGLSFALGNPGQYIGGKDEVEKYVSSRPIISPVFEPGDAFFFDVLSLHKTNVEPHMELNRVAYKLGAKNALSLPPPFDDEFIPVLPRAR